MSRLTLTMLCTFVGWGILFSVWPGIDLAVSAAFFDPVTGFYGDHAPFSQLLYRGIPTFSRIIIIGLICALLIHLFMRSPQAVKRRIQIGYLVAALILGPGLVIDAVLKSYWGRARPVQVTEFGGERQFTPALYPARQCKDNCSFVSGHAAAGFYFVSLGFLGGPLVRRRWTLTGLFAGAIFGYGRITQGGHFLSDVVFSFYACWFSAWVMWWLFVKIGWFSNPSAPAETRQTAISTTEEPETVDPA